MKINKLKLSNSIAIIILITPLVLIYLYLFWISNDLAFDRDNYFRIVSHPFEGRTEWGLNAIAWLLKGVIEDPKVKLLIIQIGFVYLYIITLIRFFDVSKIVNVSKVVFLFIFSIGLFSHVLGVQLRIGYAMILFVFLFFGLKLKPNLKNLFFYALPGITHMALIPVVLLLYSIKIFRITSYKKFFLYGGVFLAVTFVLLKLATPIFHFLGLGAYYLDYLDPTKKMGRAFPFSVIFYLLSIFFLIMNKNNKNNRTIIFWLCLWGLFFVVLGFVFHIYVAFKILSTITMCTFIYYLDAINMKRNSALFLILFSLLLSPLVFLYFAKQVHLFLH